MSNSLSLTVLEFGSLFSYTPRPNSTDSKLLEDMKKTKNWTIWLKQNRMVSIQGQQDTMSMSDYVATILERNLTKLPFNDFFDRDTTLVPVPRNAPLTKDGLWVPDKIANAMVKRGIGSSVVPCLIRSVPVNKSGQANSTIRPLPKEHYESVSISTTLTGFDEIVLIDDVITRGATLIGLANKMADQNPGIRIRAFSAIRTISNPTEFTGWFKPVRGTITLRSSGDAIRRP